MHELEDFGITVQLHDPMADGDLLREEFKLRLTPIDALKPADAVVLSVAHRRYCEGGWDHFLGSIAGYVERGAGMPYRASGSGVWASTLHCMIPLLAAQRT